MERIDELEIELKLPSRSSKTVIEIGVNVRTDILLSINWLSF